jgi:SynChlorMet cassette radical SAM/SPASM protein ScmE
MMFRDDSPYYDPTVPPSGLSLRPRSVDVAITGRCNLKCRYCFYADEMAALNDLSTERWLGVFDELGALAVQRVTISGGEAFTRPDIFELIDAVIANKMRYSLLTNGTLITEKTIAAFEQGKRRLRLDSIQVSIDGSRAEIHNKSRPPNSFERALRGLRMLKEAGFPVTVRVTINRHNVDDLENIAHLLLEDIGLASFGTNEAEPMGEAKTGACSGQDVVLSEEQRRRAMKSLVELKERYPGRISATAGPLSRAEMFADIQERMSRGESSMTGRGTLSSCGGVFSKMSILHDGSMVPCNMLPTLTMGVVGINPIQEAWLHHPSINAVRYRRNIPLTELESCRDCPYSGFCTGGCPAGVMAKTGKLNSIDPEICFKIYNNG